MPTVNIAPYQGAPIDTSGPGYFQGICTVDGSPVQGVAVQAVHSVTGANAGYAVSGVDGTWRIEGVNPDQKFDILYRGDAINKVGQIYQNMIPIRDVSISFTSDFDEHLRFVNLLVFVRGGELHTYGNSNYNIDASRFVKYEGSRFTTTGTFVQGNDYKFKEGLSIQKTDTFKNGGTFKLYEWSPVNSYNATVEFTVRVRRDARRVSFLYAEPFWVDVDIDGTVYYGFYDKNINQQPSSIVLADYIKEMEEDVHFALTKEGDIVSLFINGKKVSSGVNTVSASGNFLSGSLNYNPHTKNNFVGVFYNYRYTSGFVRYRKDFHPPNKHFPLVAA